MNLSLQDLQAAAAASGFSLETLDKVIRLIELLNAFRAHPFLKDRMVLKGGTALNLFVFDLPRLSVDIDLNYVGSADREVMLAEREKVEQAITAICGREGFTLRRVPQAHAGGKWRLGYTNALERNANLEIDVIFTLRVPLWPIQIRDSHPVGSFRARDIPVLDMHELAAGKLSALFTRHVSRDLFDAHALLGRDDLDRDKLRLGFVVYGACSRRDWRDVSPGDISCDHTELQRQLVPVLSRDVVPAGNDTHRWIEQLVYECRKRVGLVLPFEDHEREFLVQVNEQGIIAPERLTGDGELATRIRQHPQLQWKVKHVREHRRLPNG
ncbi:MAG: nucleotidyl transferase AbiEii/AbiGii toxin family protein [Proteobacteria bacterium]|nr:nucleotidyl transferase AbiEii/AbiGii toxin family protein [Pseudomonadota bacterium]